MTPEEEGLLRERALYLGVDAEKYLSLTPRKRNVLKAQFILKVKRDAKESGDDWEKAVEDAKKFFPQSPASSAEAFGEEEEDMDEMEEAEAPSTMTYNGQVLTRITPEKRKEIAARAAAAVAGKVVNKPNFPPPYEVQDGIKVYTEGTGETPPMESDPLKRDGLTVGQIHELERPPVADLVGDRPPRTLADLYARWPIADDDSYCIRVERTKPKRHAGVDVAGFVGEIRGRQVKESDLHRWLGGTEYQLTVYGPDPRGKRDLNDLPIVKPLTDPIRLVVPVLPPNVGAIPAVQGESVSNSNPMNPFGPQAAAPMTNQHDAHIHKTNMDFASSLLKMQREDDQKSERSSRAENAGIFAYLAESQKTQAETMRQTSESQRLLMEKQLEAERRARERAEEKVDKIAATFESTTGKGFDMESLAKLLTTVGPNREAESQRQADYYRMQMDAMKSAHDEALKQLRDRNMEELRRADERIKDNETFYKRLLEDERAKAAERERDMRNEIDKIRREERDLAAQRLSDAKERFESELRQSEKSHERELRSLKDSFDTKVDVADRTHQMTMSQIQERLQEAQAEAERAREEARESADPVKVMEKAKAQAEAMGFEKRDDTPKTALERFAATAGAGLSQALASINEWGPQMLAARTGGGAALGARPGPQMRQLPPHVQAQVRAQQQPQRAPQPGAPRQQAQQRPAGQRRRTRAATWATEDVGPMQAPVVPETPLGFQSASVEEPAQPEPQEVETQSEVQSQEPQAESLDDFHIPEKYLSVFPKEAILGFLAQAEQSIHNGVDATVFADMFLGQYPEEAKKMVGSFGYMEILDVVRGFPGAETSILVMRDGEKWMEALWSYIRARNPAAAQSA